MHGNKVGDRHRPYEDIVSQSRHLIYQRAEPVDDEADASDRERSEVEHEP
jgi:hypothetical protein